MNKLSAVDLRQTLFNQHQNNPLSSDPDYLITNLLSDILPTVYIIASIIVFLYFAFGGVMVIASAGNAENAQKGQQAITNAIIGFVVIFTSFWIIELISVITGIPIFGT